MTYNIQRIDHIELFVSELDEAVRWYRDTFGFTPVEKYREWADNGPLMIGLDDNSTMIALWEGKAQQSQTSRGFHRLAFAIDADGFTSFINEIGGNIDVYNEQGERLSEIELVDHDLTYSVYFCDPFGNRLEVTTEDHSEVQSILEL